MGASVSLILMWLFFFFLAVTAKLHLENYVYVNFSVPVLVLLGGVIVLLCAIHFIVPYQILRKKQPDLNANFKSG